MNPQAQLDAVLADNIRLAPMVAVAKHLSHLQLYSHKGIDALHPQVRPLCDLLLKEAAAALIPVIVTSTFRTAAEQDALYAQGRTAPGNIVTQARGLESLHNYALAFDVAFTGNTPYPSIHNPVWKQLAEIGTKHGLVWGGTFGDYPHFEYHPGFTWRELKAYFS
jgi:peptidoglycan L-alanyl-D-glutamate endopeptidase CwlK